MAQLWAPAFPIPLSVKVFSLCLSQLTTVYKDTPPGSALTGPVTLCREMGRASWHSCQGTGGFSCTPGMRGNQSCSRCSGAKREAVMLCRLKETTRGSISCPIPAVPSSPHNWQGQPAARRRHRNDFAERNRLPPIPVVPNPCGIPAGQGWAGSVSLQRGRDAARGWEGAQFNP